MADLTLPELRMEALWIENKSHLTPADWKRLSELWRQIGELRRRVRT